MSIFIKDSSKQINLDLSAATQKYTLYNQQNIYKNYVTDKNHQ